MTMAAVYYVSKEILQIINAVVDHEENENNALK